MPGIGIVHIYCINLYIPLKQNPVYFGEGKKVAGNLQTFIISMSSRFKPEFVEPPEKH